MPSVYWLNKQIEENRLIDNYLSLHNLSGLPISKGTAIKVSDQVRNDFNTNEATFKFLDMKKRPFLRNSVLELLTCREGLCGEGAGICQ